MRVSEGELCGRNVCLYHPELFKNREEVIIFTRDEFKRHYEYTREQMNFVTKEYLLLNRDEDWGLLGIWPKIMERIYLIDQHMQSMITKNSVQSYLDTYLYTPVEGLEINVEESQSEMLEKYRVPGWSLI